MRNKQVFKVIIENWGRGIEFRNFFEFGQWGPIKRELVKLKKELIKTHEKNFKPTKIDMAAMKKDFEKINEDHFLDFKLKFNGKTFLRDFLGEKLRRECSYYFWGKCEYEVVIKGWPNEKTERKIDVYTQLIENWDVFEELVFKEIGV